MEAVQPMEAEGQGRMRRAFLQAVVLHLAGALGFLYAVKHWPMVVLPPPVSVLELDVAPAPVAERVRPPMTGLEQARAVLPVETRTECIPSAPVPEARVAAVPEPVMANSSPDPVCVPGPPALEQRGLARPAMILPEAAPLAPASVVSASGSGDPKGRPTALSEIQPRYPYSSRTKGEEGKVTVHIRVTDQGEAESVRIRTSSGYSALDASALATARKARFKPAEREGKPVPAEMDLHFDFRLQD